MLALPHDGMPRSIDSHNINFDILCDWIEGSILFDENEDEFFLMDVVDVLTDKRIYENQEFAEEIVTDAWNELERRVNRIGSGVPFSVTDSQITRMDSWQDTPAHSFCVLVSLARCYRKWWRCISKGDYNEQGELFELLTQESLKKQFADWKVKRTGWSRTHPTRLYDTVKRTANWLGRATRNNVNPDSRGKEAGLDLLCYHPFPDNRAGFPVYLMQCTTRQDWEQKVTQPSIARWFDFIDFVVRPQKAFAIPFAPSDEDFRDQCVDIEGMFLDRCRLLAAARYCKRWESSSLKDRIIKWAEPRINQLPRD